MKANTNTEWLNCAIKCDEKSCRYDSMLYISRQSRYNHKITKQVETETDNFLEIILKSLQILTHKYKILIFLHKIGRSVHSTN